MKALLVLVFCIALSSCATKPVDLSGVGHNEPGIAYSSHCMPGGSVNLVMDSGGHARHSLFIPGHEQAREINFRDQTIWPLVLDAAEHWEKVELRQRTSQKFFRLANFLQPYEANADNWYDVSHPCDIMMSAFVNGRQYHMFNWEIGGERAEGFRVVFNKLFERLKDLDHE